jgi:hypothetical protein
MGGDRPTQQSPAQPPLATLIADSPTRRSPRSSPPSRLSSDWAPSACRTSSGLGPGSDWRDNDGRTNRATSASGPAGLNHAYASTMPAASPAILVAYRGSLANLPRRSRDRSATMSPTFTAEKESSSDRRSMRRRRSQRHQVTPRHGRLSPAWPSWPQTLAWSLWPRVARSGCRLSGPLRGARQAGVPSTAAVSSTTVSSSASNESHSTGITT